MSNPTLFPTAAATLIGASLAGSACGQFTGYLAPDTWNITIDPPASGGSVFFASDGSVATITGGDSGIAGNVDMTHRSLFTVNLTFGWTYTSVNTPGFDAAYYLLNGESFFLTDGSSSGSPVSGRATIPIVAGDTFGWRVHTVDGIYGPGVLSINNFEFSVPPSPGALPLLGLAAIAGRRRRRE
jgi:MYXO-CTERM domain-containing protein